MANIRCTTAEEVLEALASGGIPEIYGTFDVGLSHSCALYVSDGAPHIQISQGFVRIFTYNVSTPRISVYGSGVLNLDAFNISSPKVEAYDSGTALIRGWHSSMPKGSAHGSSKVTIWMADLDDTTELRGDGTTGVQMVKPSSRVALKTSLDVLLSEEI